LYVRKFSCNNTPFSRIDTEKYLVLLKGKFKILGEVGSRIAKELTSIPGIETTITKDYIRITLLLKHKWKEIEPLIIEILSQNLNPSYSER
jgi:hypothetical protein